MPRCRRCGVLAVVGDLGVPDGLVLALEDDLAVLDVEEHLEEHLDIPCESGIWYDMKEKKNLAKVNTPEVAAAIIEKVKGSCSQSAPLMEGSCDAPDDFERRP